MYTCKHFHIYELVDPTVYSAYRDRAWDMFDPKILMALDGVWEFFNPNILMSVDEAKKHVSVRVNNWFWGGHLQWRGLRTKVCKIGATKSEHRLLYYRNRPPHRCSAMDYDVQGMSAQDVRDQIVANQDNPLLQHITRLEKGTSWVHMDCKPVGRRIKVFMP